MSEEEDHGGSGEEEESPASDSNDVQPVVLEGKVRSANGTQNLFITYLFIP